MKERTENLSSFNYSVVEEIIEAGDRALLVPRIDYPFEDENEVRLEPPTAKAPVEGLEC